MSAFADGTDTGPTRHDALRGLKSMRPRMVMVVVTVMVPMVRRVRKRNVCQKNHCDREGDNLNHDSILNLSR